MDDGRLRYELKRAWKDGTRTVILSPLDLCARVCALIPAPGFNMVRYYGCLSSHSALRKEVVPEPPPAVHNPLLDDGNGQLTLEFDQSDAQQRSGKRRPWAYLLRHVWEVDVSSCSRCGGPMKSVEVATEPQAIRRVLAGLGHEHGHDGHGRGPPRRPPPPGQLRFGFG